MVQTRTKIIETHQSYICLFENVGKIMWPGHQKLSFAYCAHTSRSACIAGRIKGAMHNGSISLRALLEIKRAFDRVLIAAITNRSYDAWCETSLNKQYLSNVKMENCTLKMVQRQRLPTMRGTVNAVVELSDGLPPVDASSKQLFLLRICRHLLVL